MCPELLLPLDCLPGPVPEGAPRLYQTPTGDWMPWDVLGRRWSSSDPDGWTWQERALIETWPVAIDLSRPPVDAAGYPTRIDGADVAAGMLARAMGLDPRGGVSWGRCFDLPHWTLAGGVKGNGRSWSLTFAGPLRRGQPDTLSHIDPAAPDADRLALVAVIRAAPWRK